MFVWWKSAGHLFTIEYLWLCLAFLIQLLLHGFLQPQVRQHYFSPLSAFPLLFPLFMKSNWFLCPALCSLDRFSSRPAISLSFLERVYLKKVTFLSLAASAQKKITDTYLEKEEIRLWNREMNLLIVQNLTTRQFHVFIAFFYNRTLLRNSLSRNIKRVAYPNHIAVFLIEHQ